jgi:hypothetical protein
VHTYIILCCCRCWRQPSRFVHSSWRGSRHLGSASSSPTSKCCTFYSQEQPLAWRRVLSSDVLARHVIRRSSLLEQPKFHQIFARSTAVQHLLICCVMGTIVVPASYPGLISSESESEATLGSLILLCVAAKASQQLVILQFASDSPSLTNSVTSLTNCHGQVALPYNCGVCCRRSQLG